MSELSTFIGGASGAKPWVSGAVIKQYAYVISPADLEIYQRKTATGSGTTDPYSDTTNYRPVSINRLASITNGWSSGVWTAPAADTQFAGTTSSTPALSAGVRTSVLSATGKGSLDFAAYAKASSAATSGTFRIELIIDGRTLFDATFANPSTSNYAVIQGVVPGGTGVIGAIPMDCPFSQSMQIYVTSSAGVAANVMRFSYAMRGYQS